jgi:peroxiredoxin
MAKNYLITIAAGIGILMAVGLTILFLSADLRLSFLVGVLLLLSCAWLLKKIRLHFLIKAVLLFLPIATGYYLLIISELSNQLLTLPFFAVASVAGSFTEFKHKAILATCVLMASILFSLLVIPNLVAASLSDVTEKKADDFRLMDIILDKEISLKEFENRILLVDFFGTWCTPCIAEMRELKKLQAELKEMDVEILAVYTDEGGDTKDKVTAFMTKYQFAFRVAYDSAGVAHKQFGFSGFPGLVMIDKNGNIVMTHEGYNPAEDFDETIRENLKTAIGN